MNPKPIGGSGGRVVSSWLCYGVTIAIVVVAVGCIFGVSYVVYRSSAIPQGFLDTMQLLEADTDGTALVVRANAMTNDDVSRAIEVIRSVEFRSKPRSSLDVLSEVRRADSVSMTVHYSMLLAVRREDAAASAIMESLERFLTMTPLPDYSEPVASEWYFGTRYSPIPTLAWALVRLKGLDGFNELSHRFSTIETQPEWKQEILRFTGVLSWADYHAAEVDTTVPPMSSAFDDRWLVRFTAAAQERGYTLFASDARQTGAELERILRDFETDYFGKTKTPTIKELWLAASASITLRELDLSDKGRRVFPFGMGLTHLLWSPRGGKVGRKR